MPIFDTTENISRGYDAAHKHELQSIKWKIADLDEKIEKGRKQKKKISHWLEERRNLMTRRLEIETEYFNAARNHRPNFPGAGMSEESKIMWESHKERQRMMETVEIKPKSLWQALLGFFGVK